MNFRYTCMYNCAYSNSKTLLKLKIDGSRDIIHINHVLSTVTHRYLISKFEQFKMASKQQPNIQYATDWSLICQNITQHASINMFHLLDGTTVSIHCLTAICGNHHHICLDFLCGHSIVLWWQDGYLIKFQDQVNKVALHILLFINMYTRMQWNLIYPTILPPPPVYISVMSSLVHVCLIMHMICQGLSPSYHFQFYPIPTIQLNPSQIQVKHLI